jgi:hypothetical protein
MGYVFNQAVKRNKDRFPKDFRFQLTKEEKAEVVTICDHLEKLKYSPVLPYVFTEHGVIMAANVLNSARAIEASIMIVRAFIKLRQMVVSHVKLAKKINRLEKKYDTQLRLVFNALKQLMQEPVRKTRRIGFGTKNGNK